MAEIELKSFHSSDYIDDEFTGEFLEAVIQPAGKQPQKDQVVFLFKNPSGEAPLKLTNWGLDKLVSGRADGKNIDNFNQLGITAGCLGDGYKHKDKKFGGYAIRMIIDTDKKTVSFIPTIAHKIMHLIPIDTSKNVSKEGEKEFKKFAIEFVESKQTVTAPETQKTAGLTPELKQKWEDFLIENLTEPTNEAGIHRAMVAKITDVAVRTPLAAVRKQSLQELVKEGKINIDDEGRYSVILR